AGEGDGVEAAALPPDARAWTETEQLAFEKETLGLYWSGHPVDRYASALRDLGAKTIADLAEAQPAPPRGETWGPEGRKSFEPELPDASTPMRVKADVSAQIRVRPSPALIAEVERVTGAGSVELR